MSWHRIQAVVVRHLYLFRKSPDRWSDMVYWPVLDIVMWGLTSRWITQSQAEIPNLVLLILTALVFWQVVWRANYEISVNLLEELWNQNVVNLFSTPLTVIEWVLSVMIVGGLKLILTVAVATGAVWLLYAINVFAIGWSILPFFALLMMSGWFMGFLAAGLIIYYGHKIQTIAWSMGFLFAPFSAVYYPLATLPPAVQMISRFLPMTYVFEGMRTVINHGPIRLDYLLISLGLNLLYLFLALAFFVFMFARSRVKGLARLE
jgi:ABC-2 type transport system permease protein